MLIDFPSAVGLIELNFDLCIIGAGAAGIAIANEFNGTQIKIGLIESGGFEGNPEQLKLYEGKSIGIPYNLTNCRLNWFGGSTNHWHGWCQPLAKNDFRKKPWLSYSGWDISYTDLEPFYHRAHEYCDLGEFAYDSSLGLADSLKSYRFNKSRFQLKYWRFSPPTRFGSKYRETITSSPNITLLTNCNTLTFNSSNDGSNVTSISVASLGGKKGTIGAKIFVLACGGIENPRILLNSDSVHEKGLGNDHDLVGRFFMEHPHIRCGYANTVDSDKLEKFFERRKLGEIYIQAGIVPSVELQNKKQILNSSISINLRDYSEKERDIARVLADKVGRGDALQIESEELLNLFYDMDVILSAPFSRRKENQKDAVFYARSEQAPNPNSRITLDNEKDTLGQRKVKLDWQLSEIDKRTIEVMIEQIGIEFGRLDLGRVRRADWVGDGIMWKKMEGGCHHIGTTRMSANPKEGVVDTNCKIHSCENVFITGSSVFPTSGAANPTLTILALALRLSDHLKTFMNH